MPHAFACLQGESFASARVKVQTAPRVEERQFDMTEIKTVHCATLLFRLIARTPRPEATERARPALPAEPPRVAVWSARTFLRVFRA